MPVRVVDCLRWRRSMTAVRVARRLGLAVSVGGRWASGCRGSTRRGLTVLSTERRWARHRGSAKRGARRSGVRTPTGGASNGSSSRIRPTVLGNQHPSASTTDSPATKSGRRNWVRWRPGRPNPVRPALNDDQARTGTRSAPAQPRKQPPDAMKILSFSDSTRRARLRLCLRMRTSDPPIMVLPRSSGRSISLKRTKIAASMFDLKNVAVEIRDPLLPLGRHLEMPQAVPNVGLYLVPEEFRVALR